MSEEKFSLDEIRKYWREQAVTCGQSPSASWSDHHAIELEIKELLKRVHDGETVLDIGCANGYSTVGLASVRNISITGVDYIPEMVLEANRRLSHLDSSVRERVKFAVGDICNLDFPENCFDKIVTVRVLINLGDPERQLKAFKEVARVLKPGGILLLSEATVQGWTKLNQIRSEWGLPNISMPAFNCYLDESWMAKELSGILEIEEVVNFASSYFIGTRLIKPLLAKLADREIDISDPEMHWNRWCSMLPNAGDYGTQKLFVIRKPLT